MTRIFCCASLALLSLLAACPGKPQVKQAQTPPPDYGAIRDRAEQAHKALDQEKGPLGQ